MITTTTFSYTPGEHESESASNSYLMSLVAVIAGLPLPIINLIATFIFYVGNRDKTYFVRWHCLQALFSQISLLAMNSVGFYWTLSIIFSSATITNHYIAYMITIFLFNLGEFIATIYTAIKTRQGLHVEWIFYGTITNLFCKP
jgi:uncharacterized Tic20 family protein